MSDIVHPMLAYVINLANQTGGFSHARRVLFINRAVDIAGHPVARNRS
jgi:hypothetical protein